MKTIYQLLLLALTFSLSAATADNSRTYNIKDYGAKGDGTTDNVAAIQQAINDCSQAGGGRVIIPSGGVYMTSLFQ